MSGVKAQNNTRSDTTVQNTNTTNQRIYRNKKRPSIPDNQNETNQVPSKTNSTSSFNIILQQFGSENVSYGGLIINSLGIDKIKLSNKGSVLFSCYTTGNNKTYFLDQTPIAYNGMSIEGKTIYNFAEPDLSKDGKYGFLATFDDRSMGIVIDGKIIALTGETFNGYIIESFTYMYPLKRLTFNESGQYIVEVIAKSVIGNGRHQPYILIDGSFNSTYTPPVNDCPKGSHCEVNSVGHYVYTQYDKILHTKENNLLPVISNAFVLNNKDLIFSGDLQLLNYSDAKPNLNMAPDEFKKSHDKYVIDFPYESLFGIKPQLDGNDVPSFGDYTDNRIAMNDNGMFAFFFKYGKDGKWVTALVKGTPNGVASKENKPELPKIGDVVIYWGSDDGGLRHSGYVSLIINGKVELITYYSQDEKTVVTANPNADKLKKFGNWVVYQTERIPQR